MTAVLRLGLAMGVIGSGIAIPCLLASAWIAPASVTQNQKQAD